MKLRYIMILSIIIKIIIGMSGVIFFLRISGKTQMAQLTPLDSVNAFVLGALIGGVIYNPDLSVWYMIFALGTWTIVNMTIRYLLRFSLIRRLVKGDTVMIVRNGQMLREVGIFSMFDVDDARFETNGKLTVSLKRNISESYLFVNNGSILQSSLDNAGKKETWLLAQLKKLGYEDIDSLFCVEWTPGKGFYIAAKNTDSHKSGQAHSDNDISN